jgi:hypothetical protein
MHRRVCLCHRITCAANCVGKNELLQEMTRFLFCEADALVEWMRASLSNSDGTEIADTVHRLKSTVAYQAAPPALAAIGHVEEIRYTRGLSAAPAALRKRAMELDRLESALNDHRPKVD